MSPLDAVLAALESRGANPRKSGSGFEARCPAHDDNRASLSLTTGDDGKALLRCHAGCEFKAIVSALGLQATDLFPERQAAKKLGPIEAVYQYRDERGEVLFEAVRFKEPKDFRQRRPGAAHGDWSIKGVRRVLYRLPELREAIDAGRPVYLAEGEKDVDNLVSIGLAATCNPMGAGKWSPDYTGQLAGASRAIIIADKDEPGRKHARMVAESLRGTVADVRVLEVPGAGKDASDWIAAGGTREALEALAEGCAPWSESSPFGDEAPAATDGTDRPTFQLRKGYGHEATLFASRVLARHPSTFQRDGRLVVVTAWQEEPDPQSHTRREVGSPVVRDMTPAMLWERQSELIQWQKLDARSGKLANCDPSHDVVSAVLQRGEWPGMRELRGIIGAPALRPDGTIIDQPGYDAATGLLYVPAGPCDPIPDRPTREDALAARDALLDVVCDFPFERDAHRAAWFAGVMTPIVRPVIGNGNVPLFMVDANSRGAGKGLLVHSAAIIDTGRTAPCEAFTPDAAEMDKRIVAHLQAADAIVNLDNVATDFGGPVLDKLLTSEGLYASRKLGSNDAAAALKLPNLATWWATLNNAALTGDLVRRAIHIRLATEYEHPEEREGFRHPNLLSWVRQERPRLLAAALTVARAWFVAGRPCAEGLSAFGSFEQWSSTARAICAWLDLPDPWKDTVEGLRQADRGDDLHGALLVGLAELDSEGRGVSTGEIKRLLEADMAEASQRDRAPRYADLIDAMGVAGLVADGKVNAQKLGRRLQIYRDKRKAGSWITEIGRDSRNGTPRWAVVSSESAGVRECAGVYQPTRGKCQGSDSYGGATGSTPADSRSPAQQEAVGAYATYGEDEGVRL